MPVPGRRSVGSRARTWYGHVCVLCTCCIHTTWESRLASTQVDLPFHRVPVYLLPFRWGSEGNIPHRRVQLFSRSFLVQIQLSNRVHLSVVECAHGHVCMPFELLAVTPLHGMVVQELYVVEMCVHNITNPESVGECYPSCDFVYSERVLHLAVV